MTSEFKRKVKVVPVRYGLIGPIIGEATVETQTDGVMALVTITDPRTNEILLESLNVGGFGMWKDC